MNLSSNMAEANFSAVAWLHISAQQPKIESLTPDTKTSTVWQALGRQTNLMLRSILLACFSSTIQEHAGSMKGYMGMYRVKG